MLLKPAVPIASIVLALVATGVDALDPWDLPWGSDNNYLTSNVLWHAAPPQVHDLEPSGGSADQDWYLINPRARRSYEVLFANIGPDAEIAYTIPMRVAGDATTILQSAVNPDASDRLLTLRWIQGASSSTDYVRVNGYFTSYVPGSAYTVQYRETTLYCERYNNTGGQSSVLIIQRTNPDRSEGCDYEARYNNAVGTEVGTSTGTLAGGNAMAVIPTANVAGVNATSGSAFIAHTCGIGGIKAKMVALEPATGFSFDTSCQPRSVN